jgi:hypothetical protein
MFMETYVLDEKLKSYVELCCDKLFAKKHLMGGMIEAFRGSSMGGNMGAIKGFVSAMASIIGGIMGSMLQAPPMLLMKGGTT